MTLPADEPSEYTLDHTRWGDRLRVDDEGYLHTGSGPAHVDSITIERVDTR